MRNIIQEKIESIVMTLGGAGVLLLILGILVTWDNFLARLVLGTFILIVSFMFLYLAFKIVSIKKDVEKFLKF